VNRRLGEKSSEKNQLTGPDSGWTASAREEEKMEIGPGIGRFWFF
jgi:hypothetical protein